MSCNCNHHREDIAEGRHTIAELRKVFIKRMTVDSEHSDARRSDFNQAIFFQVDDDADPNDYSTYQEVFCKTDMGMVLRCFDDAVKDWRKSFCDVDNCRRHTQF